MSSGRDIGAPLHPVTTQVKSFSTDASAAIANAIGNGVYCVRIVADQDCHVKFAASPTAVVSDMFLPANTVEYYTCRPGQKVAVITPSGGTGGIVNVTEMAR